MNHETMTTTKTTTRGGPFRARTRVGFGILCVAVAGALNAAPATAQEEGFTDRTVTLERAVERAVQRNPQLRAARWSLEEADRQVKEAWGNVFPSVDFSSTYTRNLSAAVNFLPAIIFDPNAGPDELIPVRFGSDNSWNLSVNVEQPLFNAAAFIGVGAAGRFQALQDETVRGEAQAVVTRVRTAYYQLLLSQEQVRLLENSVARVRASLEESRALNEAGLVSDYDVLRLEVELANLEPNLRRARNQIAQGRRTLAVELDLDPEEADALVVAGELAAIELDDPSANSADNAEILAFAVVPMDAPVGDLVGDAMATRSDVRQLELTESLRQTELRLQQIEYLPEVSIFGSYTINSQQNGDPDFFGGPRAYGRTAGVRVTLPIFQGFQRHSRIGQRRAVLEQARTQTDFARAQASSQIRTLVEAAEEALERARGQRLAVEQAQRGFEIARAEYGEGIASQLALTDAEGALRDSEFNYAQAVYDYLVARAQLDEAVGRVPLVDGGAR